VKRLGSDPNSVEKSPALWEFGVYRKEFRFFVSDPNLNFDLMI
jgi:hypothetical protein